MHASLLFDGSLGAVNVGLLEADDMKPDLNRHSIHLKHSATFEAGARAVELAQQMLSTSTVIMIRCMAALGVPSGRARAAATADLGVDGLEEGLLPKVLLCPHEGLPDGRLATASRAQQEDRPAHHKDLTKLADLETESLIRLVAQLQSCLLDLYSGIVVRMMKLQILETKLCSSTK